MQEDFHYYATYCAAFLSGYSHEERTLESKRYGARSWKLDLSHGIVEILIVIACFVFIKNPGMVAIIYGIGLAYSGLMSMITAC